MDFDDVLRMVGEWGRYQKWYYLMVSLPVLFKGYQVMLVVFTVFVPKHRLDCCAIYCQPAYIAAGDSIIMSTFTAHVAGRHSRRRQCMPGFMSHNYCHSSVPFEFYVMYLTFYYITAIIRHCYASILPSTGQDKIR